MFKELISIVVPIYNVEKYLRNCIDSIIKQTYTNLEIILVDDGSLDNCGKICDEYKEKDNRIKVIHKQNGGLSDARNAGIDIATGKYIAFIDSDDYIAPNFIEKLYNLCIKNNAELSECDFQKVTEECNDIIENTNQEEEKVLDGKKFIERLDGKSAVRTVVVWNKLYRREIFNNLRFPKGKLNEDEFTTYKIFYDVKKIAITTEQLYFYRYSPDSIMNKKFNKKRLDILEALEVRLDFFKEKKEQKLYEMTLKKYMNKLITMDMLCKRFLSQEKEIRNNIKHKYNSRYSEILHTDISLKLKIKYVIYRYIPFIIYLNWRRKNG